MKFYVHSFNTLGEMAWTKIEYDNKQRTITQKIKNTEYRLLYTALFLNEIFHPMKFQVLSFNTLGEMVRTKIKYEN
jgi:hypothetical protein